MNISIFGLGYVGCVSLGCLAELGHKIIGVDINRAKIDLINSGKATVIEENLDKIISDHQRRGNVYATQDYISAVIKTDISIICVGTPPVETGHLDHDHIFRAAHQISEGLKAKGTYHVISIRSTVCPGTNAEICDIIEANTKKRRNVDFSVVSNPEFLREGNAVFDFFNPPYTVIGSDCIKSTNFMREIYKDIKAPLEDTSIEVAEMIKYINNSFHALKIAFANEIGNICKKLDIDSHLLMELFCKDRRLNISSKYLKPGLAYGGSCLPKDLKAFVTLAHDRYLTIPVLESIERSNKSQIKVALKKIISSEKKSIGILGLAFKEGTDDLRYSPAVEIVEILIGKGFNVFIYDDKVSLSKIIGSNREYINRHVPHIAHLISNDLKYVISHSELIVIMHNCDLFNNLHEKYKDKQILDFVRISTIRSGGNYEGICW